ncbi:MAG: sugar phosphate isomerase/epimerase [Acidobacteria bacterium]|nr:sugar phosphate isomerase/epimerase [Acidobacteriota bacterium]
MAVSANDNKIRFGAEVYTWFMKESGRAHANQLDHMIQIAARAGFQGIEPMHFWMGDLRNAGRLAECLDSSGIKLAAISLVLGWNHKGETDEERDEADEVINLLARFPGASLGLVQMPTSREDLAERRKRLLRNLHAVAGRAADRGIPCSFHPNSPHTSIARTAEDYEVLLGGIDRRLLGWTPDVGHIANGGMNPLKTMQQYAELINHVHFKDWDGAPEFCQMGKGKINFVEITRWLQSRNYGGWIICEDEGPEAVDNPDGVTLKDGEWVRKQLLPAL